MDECKPLSTGGMGLTSEQADLVTAKPGNVTAPQADLVKLIEVRRCRLTLSNLR